MKILKSFLISLIVLLILIVGMEVFLIIQEQKNRTSVEEDLLKTPYPTPEIPSDWKTYRNEEYGFEIKYPLIWSYNYGPLPYTFYFGEGGPYEYQVGIWVTSESNFNEAYFYTEEENRNCRKITVASEEGWRCEIETWSEFEKGIKTGYRVKMISIEVKHKENYYYFSVAASEDRASERFKYFDQMLSTFRFIE